MTSKYMMNRDKMSVYTSFASLVASLVAGSACIGPLLGIAMGIGGLGWLSQYYYLTVPASVVSLVLLSIALLFFFKRKTSCANRRKHIMQVYLIGAIAIAVIGINVFEYIIFPNFY